MSTVNVIPLEFWQDPVEDVILIYSEWQCSVYFACWSDAGESADFIGRLTFEQASEVRSARRECSPYCVPEHSSHSYILEITDSELVREYLAFRKARSPEVPLSLFARRHFVVTGHDIYHEIVAASFTATTIPNHEVTDSILRPLVTVA